MGTDFGQLMFPGDESSPKTFEVQGDEKSSRWPRPGSLGTVGFCSYRCASLTDRPTRISRGSLLSWPARHRMTVSRPCLATTDTAPPRGGAWGSDRGPRSISTGKGWRTRPGPRGAYVPSHLG